jgi:hypothetical protein
MKRLLLATVITFTPFILPAHASDLTGEALALACQGNVPDMKREKTQKNTPSFAMRILMDGTTQRSHWQ